ncbi:MAG: lptA [Xanthomonadaceae bacterium]|nr:lptA [Xanthomonadaceae bacterium]
MSRLTDALLVRMLLVGVLSAVATVALARTGDRSQPMDAEANQNSCTLGDAGQCVMTGNVQISQGSLDIRAAKATIFRAGGDISRALLSGSPVLLKQQMDDGTLMNAHASNVDYNLSTDVVIFTGDVIIQQPRGTMSGQRVVYNLKTGSVDSGGEVNGRVKMRILPRNTPPAPAPTDTTKTKS